MIHVDQGAPAPNGTRVVITGAGGNIGRGLAPRLLAAGYELTLSDLNPVDGLVTDTRFAAADVRTGEGLQTAMLDADVLVHLPALSFPMPSRGISWVSILRTDTPAVRYAASGSWSAGRRVRLGESPRAGRNPTGPSTRRISGSHCAGARFSPHPTPDR
ncbi:hypothetical protein GCM10017710_25190 [Arthrobacter ramosus]